jgi:dTDP-4-dehydrorhamnose reductase
MPSLPKILVTGSNGQLGSELRALSSSYPGYDFVFFDRSTWPVDDEEKGNAIIAGEKAQFLVNCAAYTAVDKAETEKEKAASINGTATGYLAAACARSGTKFLHISTDYVFDGSASEPIKEDHPLKPVNAYGASKLAGEEAAMKEDRECVIIRTSWVYSSFGNNFVKTMMRLMKEKESIRVVADQYGTPTYAADLAEAVMQIIAGGKWVPGVYHFSNAGHISWYNFAQAIAQDLHSSCAVYPIPTQDYPTPAKRPRYSVLDKSKITATFGISLKDWRESLKVCLEKLLPVNN